jgi:hypothetical protein
MFEISPFSSLSEFFDLEDFIVKNCGLERFKSMNRRHSKELNRIDDRFVFQEVDRLRGEISTFCRQFNIAAHCSKTELDAQHEMCIFLPQIAQLQDSLLILNPVYKDHVNDARLLLQRMKFQIVDEQTVSINKEEACDLFGSRYNFDHRILDLFAPQDSEETDDAGSPARSSRAHDDYDDDERRSTVHRGTIAGSQVFESPRSQRKHRAVSKITIFHVTKIAGDKEVRNTIQDSGITLDDCLHKTAGRPPYKPKHIPYLFFFMDREDTYSKAFSLMYPKFDTLTGDSIVMKMDGRDRELLFELILKTTVGDRLKRLRYDHEGNMVARPEEDKELALGHKVDDGDFFQAWLDQY